MAVEKYPLKEVSTDDLHYTANAPHEWEEWGAVLADDDASAESYREGTMLWSLILLREDMKEHGCVNYLIVDPDGGVIVGNRRLCVAKTLGIDSLSCRTMIEEGSVEEMQKLYPYKHTKAV